MTTPLAKYHAALTYDYRIASVANITRPAGENRVVVSSVDSRALELAARLTSTYGLDYRTVGFRLEVFPGAATKG